MLLKRARTRLANMGPQDEVMTRLRPRHPVMPAPEPRDAAGPAHTM